MSKQIDEVGTSTRSSETLPSSIENIEGLLEAIDGGTHTRNKKKQLENQLFTSNDKEINEAQACFECKRHKDANFSNHY